MSVKDKVVLVTGGARGMGREYVRGFIKEGAKVIATDMSWAPSGFSGDDFVFLDEIKDNPNVMTDVMDITIESHVTRMYDAAIERFGTIDVVVANAGTRTRDLFLDGSKTTLETEVGDWQKMFDTHVFGNLRVFKQFTKPMLERKSGSIMSVASSGFNGSRADGREMPYQSAKAGLVTMMLYLAHELKPYNIAANVILPYHTRTTGSDEQEEVQRQRRLRTSPGAEIYMPLRANPSHVVPVALHLAEQDSEGTNGQVIHAMKWNEDNGFGDIEKWAYEEDLKSRRPARPATGRAPAGV
jgi:3-oxoacyl-[acyl-carrier protein] reductase